MLILGCSGDNNDRDNNETSQPVEEVSRFTGRFEFYRYFVSAHQAGELIRDETYSCPDIWTFNDDFTHTKVVKNENGSCTYKYQTEVIYETPGEGLIVIGGVEYIIQVNGNFSFTLVYINNEDDITKEYYLTRV